MQEEGDRNMQATVLPTHLPSGTWHRQAVDIRLQPCYAALMEHGTQGLAS